VKGTGTAAVAVRRLRRVFRRKGQERVALGGVDLVIEPGEIHGLLGPNGAGKTTLCKILSTVLLPTSGTAEVAGYDVVSQAGAVRPLIGIMFGGERGLYTQLTARQNLLHWSALYRQGRAAGRRRTSELLDRVGLAEHADDRVETFSRGMQQRLHLARSLVGDPRVLILDEPTTGMDPVAAREVRTLVSELSADGRTVLLTTHDMAEAEAICDRVSLIDAGRLLTTEEPAAIGKLLSAYERVTAAGVTAQVQAQLRQLPGVAAVTGGNGTTVVEIAAEGTVGVVLHILIGSGVTSVSTGRPSLEDVYLHLIGDRGLAVR
jgi:ABC-2 type transport system ATP-binding protein